MKTHFVALLSVLMGTSLASAETRLIETAPGVRTWMTEQQVEELSARIHAEGRCGGFMDVTDFPEQRGDRPSLGIFMDFQNRPLTQGEVLETLFKEISVDNLASQITKLSSWKNRYYKADTGLAAAEWIRDRFVELARGRTDVTVELFKHSFAQPSVVVRIAGLGREAAEHVILGGHEDSINSRAGVPALYGKAPGADDNASGISTLLETFRILMAADFKPVRTVEFIAYAAEEGGLRGSQDIAQDYQRKGVGVAGVMQFDMTLYPGKSGFIGLVKDNTDPALGLFQKKLLDTYIKMPWKEFACGYGCSDHASWTQSGYPAVMPFESMFDEYNPNIHSDGDTLDKLDIAFGTHFVKLALAFAVELGGAP